MLIPSYFGFFRATSGSEWLLVQTPLTTVRGSDYLNSVRGSDDLNSVRGSDYGVAGFSSVGKLVIGGGPLSLSVFIHSTIAVTSMSLIRPW